MFALLSLLYAILLGVGSVLSHTGTARDDAPHSGGVGDAENGVLWIVVGVAVVVFFVWLCAKIGDSSRPSDGVMG